MRNLGLVSDEYGTNDRNCPDHKRAHSLRDRGAAAVEYAGLTVLASLIVLAVMATPAAKTMTNYTGTVVDKILDTKDDIKSGPDANVDTAGAPTKQAANAVNYAMSQLGKPYVWGAQGPDTYDCSGLMMWAYDKAGVTIQRTSQNQYASQPKVPKNDLKPGDLVYFHGPPPTHVAMYIGKGNVVQAPQTGDVVKVSPLSTWGSNYIGATRPTG